MMDAERAQTHRATRAVVDLDAVEHNLNQIRRLVGDNVEILAVVKANAYGHGSVEVARVCQRAGAAMLGVASVEEGIELKQAGIRLPILVQCCVGESEITAALSNDLTLTVVSLDFAKRVSESAAKLGVVATVHADIDTGMGRIGFQPKNAAEEIARVAGLPRLALDGVYTHLTTSEIEDDLFTAGQVQLFKKLVSDLSTLGIRPKRVHAANSGAVVNYRQSHFTLVRPGLLLYGVHPHEKLGRQVDLRPALRFETAIVFLKNIPAGTSLGYGRTFIAPGPMRVATANVGYADGYPWRLSNRGKVIVRGKLAAVLGRVSMDQLIIDVSHLPEAEIGDTITLIGTDGAHTISAEDLAEWAGTIPYEILCGLSKRVPRKYLKN